MSFIKPDTSFLVLSCRAQVAIPLPGRFIFFAVNAFVLVRWPLTGKPWECRLPLYVPVSRWWLMLDWTSLFRSDSSTIDRRGSFEGEAYCEGVVAVEAGCNSVLPLPLASPIMGDVGAGFCAGMVLGEERYAESAFTWLSFNDDTVAASWSCKRAQSFRAVAWLIP